MLQILKNQMDLQYLLCLDQQKYLSNDRQLVLKNQERIEDFGRVKNQHLPKLFVNQQLLILGYNL